MDPDPPGSRESDDEKAGETERTSIQSIDRAANVLALLDQDTRSLTPSLVAERLGLPTATSSRCRAQAS
jgi:hypothetical protein